jgi:hypothetical protein
VPPAAALGDGLDDLTPARFAPLNGELALVAGHGEEAGTRSSETIIERFGHQAG